MLRPDLYYLAYNKLYRNKGAATKGVDDDTADGFSEEKINRIIQSLADETYMPKPVRREYIPKKRSSTKKRPLGLPSLFAGWWFTSWTVSAVPFWTSQP